MYWRSERGTGATVAATCAAFTLPGVGATAESTVYRNPVTASASVTSVDDAVTTSVSARLTATGR